MCVAFPCWRLREFKEGGNAMACSVERMELRGRTRGSGRLGDGHGERVGQMPSRRMHLVWSGKVNRFYLTCGASWSFGAK